jgi:hypothetical protein
MEAALGSAEARDLEDYFCHAAEEVGSEPSRSEAS